MPISTPIPFSVEERAKLREMLTSTVFAKAILHARLSRTPSFIRTEFGYAVTNPKVSVLRANNVLHEQRGWDMCEASLFSLVNEPPKPQPKSQPTFPDAGNSD
jgi:hypothetical protein